MAERTKQSQCYWTVKVIFYFTYKTDSKLKIYVRLLTLLSTTVNCFLKNHRLVRDNTVPIQPTNFSGLNIAILCFSMKLVDQICLPDGNCSNTNLSSDCARVVARDCGNLNNKLQTSCRESSCY